MKRIVLTGGGSAGHVTPNLAIMPTLKQLGYDIHYIGTDNGIEHALVDSVEGVTFHAIKSGKLRRYFSWDNFKDPFKVIYGAFQSAALIRKLKPNIVFSKGGFVSVPVVLGAWLNKVPVICHESDLTPGLANRICIRFCKKVAVTFPECKQYIGEKAVVTGTPMRDALLSGSREKGLALIGVKNDKPVLLMMGGSQGAQAINKTLREALPELTTWLNVIHLCGKGNLDSTLEKVPGYTQIEYLSEELPDVLAATDLILSRAGSNAMCEFQALQKAMLLVPYPKGAGRGDQILNAQSFERQGICHILYQENLSKDSLINALHETYDARKELEKAMQAHPASQGRKAVIALIEQYAL